MTCKNSAKKRIFSRCTCGHRKSKHRVEYEENGTFHVCEDCLRECKALGLECEDLHPYEPDNLTYILEEAKKRKLI